MDMQIAGGTSVFSRVSIGHHVYLKQLLDCQNRALPNVKTFGAVDTTLPLAVIVYPKSGTAVARS
jgi:hypothetical protein